MKAKFFLFLFCIALGSFAQEKQLLKGYFRKNSNWVKLDKKAQKLLFVLAKENVILPETAYFFELIPQDAERLGTQTVIILPLFNSNYCRKYNQLFELEVNPFLNAEHTFYASKISKNDKILDDETIRNRLYPSAWQQIQEKDTIHWGEVDSNDRDLRDIFHWIEALDSEKEVTAIGEIHWDGVDKNGRMVGGVEYTYEKNPLKKLAAEKLRSLVLTFEEMYGGEKYLSKEKWKRYFKELFEKPIVSPMGNHKVFQEKRGKEGYVVESKYCFDNQTNKHYIFNVFSPPIMILNPEKHSVQYAFVENTNSIDLFYVKNDTLYTLKDFCWQKHTPVLQPDGSIFYQTEKTKNYFSSTNEPHDFWRKLTEDKLYIGYAWYDYKKQSYYNHRILIIDPQTGEKITEIPVNSFFATDIEATRSHLIDYYAENGLKNVELSVKTNKGYYHLILEGEKCVEQTFLGKNRPLLGGYTQDAFQNGKAWYFENKNNVFYKTDIKNTEKLEKIFADPNGINDSAKVVIDEKYLNVFYRSEDAFYQKLMFQRIDKQTLKPVGEPICVYADLIIERLYNKNMPEDLNVFKTAEGWNVTFMIPNRNQFYWIKVTE